MPSHIRKNLLNYFSLVCCMTLFGLLAVSRGQDINWDLLQYHFYNGYAFLHHRFQVDIAPAMIQTYYNPFFDILNYLVISIQRPKLSIFILGSFSGVSCFFLAKIAGLVFMHLPRQQRIVSIVFTLLLGMTGAGSVSLLSTTTNDTKMAMLVIIALYCVLKSLLNTKHSIFYLFAGALIVGFCAGCKLTALCFSLALFIAYTFSKPLNRTHFFKCLGFVTFSTIGFMSINGYWMYKIYQKFQNPIFPFYNNIFHSPYAPHITFNFFLTKQTIYLYHVIFFPFFLATKTILASELPLCDIRLSAVFVLTFACIIKILITNETKNKLSSAPIRCMLLFFFAAYFIWLIVFFIYRYLLPLEVLSGVLIVYLVQCLILADWAKNTFLSMLMICATLTTSYPHWSPKHAYGKVYFSISKIPSLPLNANVLITSVPLAYIVPFLPKEAHYIGMPFLTIGINESTKAQIVTKNYLDEVLSKVTNEIDSVPTFALSFEQKDHFDLKSLQVLKYFNLTINPKECQKFTTNIGHSLSLCRVIKSQVPSAG